MTLFVFVKFGALKRALTGFHISFLEKGADRLQHPVVSSRAARVWFSLVPSSSA